VTALDKKDLIAAALPPDVRRDSAAPFTLKKKMGLCPSSGLWPARKGKRKPGA